MTSPNTASPSPSEAALREQARQEAQEREVEVHREEGTVRSEGEQNSPSPKGE